MVVIFSKFLLMAISLSSNLGGIAPRATLMSSYQSQSCKLFSIGQLFDEVFYMVS